MSDEFDKEAEREKLREKFERDQKKREHTQHMSELLLKGATMTNSHCDACGDPIFRHNGQEFCPTCSREGTESATGGMDETEAGGSPTGTESRGSPTEIEIDEDGATGTAEPAAENGTAAAGRSTAGTGSEIDAAANASAAGPNATGPSAATPNNAGPNATPNNAGPNATPNDPDTTPSPPRVDTHDGGVATEPARTPDADGSTPAENLRAARESLARTARRFAEAAERTEDPRRARDHLQAAREAAEALDALDR
ncbi:Sjogren's syndrome/scleroderma autoantigen 1 family protein [Halopenitus persicus]|uniref:Sjogren's syndrome/scleroderma autoantigen 1 family protein n=1 Tax=Halopenitus persicus TaxID=1048396 RepID=UPI000BBB250A|nr:Sjogren's syndrome/scleroderma autoantigen 1 family protein [Halopenitus persicus]